MIKRKDTQEFIEVHYVFFSKAYLLRLWSVSLQEIFGPSRWKAMLQRH